MHKCLACLTFTQQIYGYFLMHVIQLFKHDIFISRKVIKNLFKEKLSKNSFLNQCLFNEILCYFN